MQTFALLGAGFIGRVHADSLAAQPDVRFARVFDVDGERAAELADRYGAGRTDDLDAVFADPAIDAVLNYARHDYIYMCAREDFSGRHNFASTLAEHNQNALRYRQELNRRGIY